MELTMKPTETNDPTAAPAPTSGALTDLVDERLNKSLADQIAEELDQQREKPAHSDASDYARGSAEHEDEPEA
jgi:hypothetical protein